MKVSYIVCDNEHYDLCRECADKIKNMLKLANKRTSQEIKDGTVDKRVKSLKKLMYSSNRQRLR